jgi:hypothetical protein
MTTDQQQTPVVQTPEEYIQLLNQYMAFAKQQGATWLNMPPDMKAWLDKFDDYVAKHRYQEAKLARWREMLKMQYYTRKPLLQGFFEEHIQ